jgi:hypothetical protein
MENAASSLEKEVDIGALQKKYDAYQEQVILLYVHDIQRGCLLKIKDGKIEREPINDINVESDFSLEFRRLRDLLDVLEEKWTIAEIFSYAGCRYYGHRFHLDCKFKGDWFTGSAILHEVMKEYLHVLKRIIFEKNKILGVGIKAVSRVTAINAPKFNIYDDEEETEEYRALARRLGNE